MKNAISGALGSAIIGAAYVLLWLNIWNYDGEQHLAVWLIFAIVNLAIVGCALFALVCARQAVRIWKRKSA